MNAYEVDGSVLERTYMYNGVVLEKCYRKNGVVLYATEGIKLCVMTYNVQWWGGINRITDVTDAIFNEYDPDIVGFQEYVNKEKYLNDLGFEHVEMSNSEYASNLKAIASKYALSDVSEIQFSVLNENESRSYQKTYVDVNGKRICIINTHLDYTPKATQYAQAKELFEAVKNEEYFIMTGDFNTFCKQITDDDYIFMMKQFVDVGCHLANCSNQHGFLDTWSGGTNDASTNWWQTDNIITSRNIFIKEVIVDKTKITAQTGETLDHLPLIAHLVIV